MDAAEVRQLLQIAGQFQANIRENPDQALLATAWHAAFDVRMTLDDGIAAVTHLASKGDRLHPGTINEAFLASRRAAHQQGIGRPLLPSDRAARDRPVPPSAVAAIEAQADEGNQPLTGAATSALIAELGLRDRRKQKALSVPCPHCKAAAGDPCTAGGRELRKSPAHPSRMDAVGLDIDLAERRETVDAAL